MENRGSVDDVDDVVKDSSRDAFQEEDFVGAFPSESPSMAMLSSTPSGSSPYASLPSPLTIKADDRDVSNGGSVSGTKELEHALPSEPMPSTEPEMVDSLERPPAGSASVTANNHDVAPGAFAVVPSSRNTATSPTLRPRLKRLYDSKRELTNEESKQDESIANCASAGSGLHGLEAQQDPDGNEEGATIVAAAQLVRTKLYRRQWIFVGLACYFIGTAVVIIVLIVQPQSASSRPSLTSPTRSPTSLTPEAIACNFLSISNVTKCRSTFMFDSDFGDTTTGSTIPSEIGLLTQLTSLDFYDNQLSSFIPTEVGLLTQLTFCHSSKIR
ncbi:hypothetical protein MHU86_9405 [Fragilaria crotonensis]|nr:hypothetical protein MHU86_9405 [Fragilaria crotonensis]